MSANCMNCCTRDRTGSDLLCDECRKAANSSQPTSAAMRAAHSWFSLFDAIGYPKHSEEMTIKLARIIDRETGLPELLAERDALRRLASRGVSISQAAWSLRNCASGYTDDVHKAVRQLEADYRKAVHDDTAG